MAKTQWDENLLIYFELIQFFTFKDENRKIAHEADGKIPAKIYTLTKTALSNDFNTIYERDFKETGLEETPENRTNRRERLIKDLQFKIDQHIENSPLKSQDDSLISKVNSFILFLSDMDKKPEFINTAEDRKEMHNDIFKDNHFELWERLVQEFQIPLNGLNPTLNVDIDFIYNSMWKDKFIHQSIGKANFTNWIKNKYPESNLIKIRFTNIKGNSNKDRSSTYINVMKLHLIEN